MHYVFLFFILILMVSLFETVTNDKSRDNSEEKMQIDFSKVLSIFCQHLTGFCCMF